jgi:hypothetical protein
VTEGNYSVQVVADYIWANYPERAQAKGIQKGTPGILYPQDGYYSVDNSKSKKLLGLEYYTFEATLKELLQQFVDLEQKKN